MLHRLQKLKISWKMKRQQHRKALVDGDDNDSIVKSNRDDSVIESSYNDEKSGTPVVVWKKKLEEVSAAFAVASFDMKGDAIEVKKPLQTSFFPYFQLKMLPLEGIMSFQPNIDHRRGKNSCQDHAHREREGEMNGLHV